MLFPKGKFPWRISAPSFVLRAGIEENVFFLADKVDDVQLLFFESPSKSLFPNNVDIGKLQKIAEDNELSYTVHLPTDIYPGSPESRQQLLCVEEIASLMENLFPLSPLCYDLHLNRQADISSCQWLDNLNEFLVLLKKEIGRESEKIAIENIDYLFYPVRSLAVQNGFALCLDMGHALLYQDDVEGILADIGRASHIHYHGVRAEKDHQVLSVEQEEMTERLGKLMYACQYTGPVTLEIYNSPDLLASLAHIQSVWLD